MIPPDPTDEIRAIKRKLSAACDYDIHQIAEQARRYQRDSGRTSVTLEPRPLAAENTTNHGDAPQSPSQSDLLTDQPRRRGDR